MDLSDLIDPVARNLEFRGLTRSQIREEFTAKEARYKKLRRVRLSAQMAELPEFGAVYREVRRGLPQGPARPPAGTPRRTAEARRPVYRLCSANVCRCPAIAGQNLTSGFRAIPGILCTRSRQG